MSCWHLCCCLYLPEGPLVPVFRLGSFDVWRNGKVTLVRDPNWCEGLHSLLQPSWILQLHLPFPHILYKYIILYIYHIIKYHTVLYCVMLWLYLKGPNQQPRLAPSDPKAQTSMPRDFRGLWPRCSANLSPSHGHRQSSTSVLTVLTGLTGLKNWVRLNN